MKSLFQEMCGTYSKVGIYYLPNLILPTEKEASPIGKYDEMRLHYLKAHRQVLYINLLTSGKLNEHLHDVDQYTTAQVDQIIASMAEQDGNDEALETRGQMC
jgi:hypothetical protein